MSGVAQLDSSVLAEVDRTSPDFIANGLGALARALTDRMEEAVTEATGLSTAACFAIVQIGSEPNSCIETLRKMLGSDHSTVVRALKKLEDLDLVERTRGDKNDARLVRINLTHAGEACFTKILTARRDVLSRAISGLSDGECDGLQVLVGKIMRNVVYGGDDQHVVCRLCDLEACRQEICPANCAHPEHFELPQEPFRRKVDSRLPELV